MARSLILVLLTAVLAALLTGCQTSRRNLENAARLTGGDPYAGRTKITQYGCQSCHTIPGVVGARALVGPPLIHWAQRTYIAGELPNTPENLTRWLQHPTQIESKTAMPEMGVTEQDSKDIAAYLYALQ
jgi:cytochrome c